MKKKKILLSLAIASMIGLAGCGEKPTEPETPVDPPVVTVDPVITGISIKAAGDKTSLEVGETLQFTATVTGEGDFNKQVTFTVDKTDVAEISSAGLLTAKAKGTVRVTATAAGDSTKKASIDITVVHSIVTGITIAAEGDATSVKISETLKLTATVAGEGNFNNKYTLSVDKPTIASISDEGVLVGKSTGTVKVTATAAGDASKTASLDITVTAAPVSAIKDVVVDKYAHVIGKVTSIGVGLYFVDDGTGPLEVYCNGYDGAVPEDIALGKVVELTGIVKDNYGIVEFIGTSGKDEYFTASISDKTIESTSLDNLTKIDAAGYDAIAKTAEKLTPIKFRGTALEGLEFKVDDASTEKLHVSYATDALKSAITVGNEYDVVGYMAPYHTKNSYNQLYIAEVKGAVYAPESVTISGDSTVRATETIKLAASVSPAKAPQNVVWTSSDETRAIVSADGTVTGVAEGPVTITATVPGTTIKAEKAITVTAAPIAPVESVTLNQESIVLDFPAESDPLVATVLPANAPSGVNWSSSDETVAKVVTANDGTVTVKSVNKGTATITATSVGKDASDVSKTASITVTVNRKLIEDIQPSGYIDTIGKKIYDSPEHFAEEEHLVSEPVCHKFYATIIAKPANNYYVLDDGFRTILCYDTYSASSIPAVGSVVLVNNPVVVIKNGYIVVARKDYSENNLTAVNDVTLPVSAPTTIDAESLKTDVYDKVFADSDPICVPTGRLIHFDDVQLTGGAATYRYFDIGDAHLETTVTIADTEIGKYYDMTGLLFNTYTSGTNKYLTFVPLEATLTTGHVYVSAENDFVAEGATLQLSAVLTGSENEDFEWSSSDKEKATVSETGLVTGVQKTDENQPVVITATSKTDPNKKGTFSISVVESYIVALTFPDENKDANKNSSGYGIDVSWEAKSGDHTFTLTGFNNNKWNNWSYIRAGAGNNTTNVKATIKTDLIKEIVSKFEITIDSLETGAKYASIKTAKLKYGTDASDLAEEIDVTDSVSAGVLSIVIPESKREANMYYSFEVEFNPSTESSGKNGTLQISKVTLK